MTTYRTAALCVIVFISLCATYALGVLSLSNYITHGMRQYYQQYERVHD